MLMNSRLTLQNQYDLCGTADVIIQCFLSCGFIGLVYINMPLKHLYLLKTPVYQE